MVLQAECFSFWLHFKVTSLNFEQITRTIKITVQTVNKNIKLIHL